MRCSRFLFYRSEAMCWLKLSEGSSAAASTLAPVALAQLESVAMQPGVRVAPEGPQERWERGSSLCFCSLSRLSSFYYFHSLLYLFLLFSSSSLLGHEPSLGSHQSLMGPASDICSPKH